MLSKEKTECLGFIKIIERQAVRHRYKQTGVDEVAQSVNTALWRRTFAIDEGNEGNAGPLRPKLLRCRLPGAAVIISLKYLPCIYLLTIWIDLTLASAFDVTFQFPVTPIHL